MQLTQYTGQVDSIHVYTFLPPQIVHDVPIFVPREHQAKSRHETRRHSIERDDIIVFELRDQNRFLAESLCQLLIQRREKLIRKSRDALTLSTVCGRGLSRRTLRTLSATSSHLYFPFQISVVCETCRARHPHATTPQSVYDVGTVHQ